MTIFGQHVCQDTVYVQCTLYVFDSNEFLRYCDQQNGMTDRILKG